MYSLIPKGVPISRVVLMTRSPHIGKQCSGQTELTIEHMKYQPHCKLSLSVLVCHKFVFSNLLLTSFYKFL